MKKCILLLSGGLDSATVLAIAKAEGYDVHALTFRYGQRHAAEIDAAREVAKSGGVTKHVVVKIDLRVFGGSALTSDVAVPKDGPVEGIPITYVPARNTIFLSFALAWAEVLDANDVFIGVNAVDYSGYPDCRPEYVEAFERMANLATRAGTEKGRRFKIHAPLLSMTKADIIRSGTVLGVQYGKTISCYDPIGAPRGRKRHCGSCDACRIRSRGFADAGFCDPADEPIKGATACR